MLMYRRGVKGTGVNKPLETLERVYIVTVTGTKVYADYEIRDMTIKYECTIKELCSVYDSQDSLHVLPWLLQSADQSSKPL